MGSVAEAVAIAVDGFVDVPDHDSLVIGILRPLVADAAVFDIEGFGGDAGFANAVGDVAGGG